ncbi:MAG: pyridoxamine 5'-phosphate oxidase family protein [Chloroflexi bacterium]|nr:pyridoxamine 5'-phosphate oxidase family protein [Chloroflexota bacterium]
MSSGDARDTLPDALIEYLAGGRLVAGATVDADGRPYTMVMNSVIAVDAHTIRFALDHRTHTLAHLRERAAMMLEVIGDGFVFGVRGEARIVKELMERCPVPSALIQFDVEAVKSDLPPGVQIKGIEFDWGSLAPVMGPVEARMFEEIRAFDLS